MSDYNLYGVKYEYWRGGDEKYDTKRRLVVARSISEIADYFDEQMDLELASVQLKQQGAYGYEGGDEREAVLR